MICDVCGRTIYKRVRTGPTSRKKDFLILVTECGKCGSIYPVYKFILYKELKWIERWNKRMRIKFENNHQS